MYAGPTNQAPDAGLNATSKWYWPCRTSNTEDLLVSQNFYWSNLSLTLKEKKTLLKIDRKHLFLFIFSSFISNIFGIFLRGNLLIKCPQMFTGPVGPVEVLFYWPKAIFWEFLLAWGHRTTALMYRMDLYAVMQYSCQTSKLVKCEPLNPTGETTKLLPKSTRKYM